MIFFALGIPVAALAADRLGRRLVLIVATLGIILFGLAYTQLFLAGSPGTTIVYLSLGLFLMGLTYGPLGTALAELFPTAVRYTGSSMTFNLAGIVGASLAPYIATSLAKDYGLAYVGYYLAAMSTLTLLALLLIGKRGDRHLD